MSKLIRFLRTTNIDISFNLFDLLKEEVQFYIIISEFSTFMTIVACPIVFGR